MSVEFNSPYTVFIDEAERRVTVLDQRLLPHRVEHVDLKNAQEAAEAIRDMTVRGAPLIGVTGAAGMALAADESTETGFLIEAANLLKSARPTAVNLNWAVDFMLKRLKGMEPDRRRKAAWHLAAEICEQERTMSIRLAKHAQTIIEALYLKLGRPLNILTHCNAGKLATVELGTATAGLYTAFEAGIPLTVYADETRPRLQGTLTAWELKAAGIPVCLIADNAGGELMREGGIDLVIVGADRIAANGDTANKIGTYLKALAAADNQIPFYVAAPISTFDWTAKSGGDIPIENRSGDEIRWVRGVDKHGQEAEVCITDPGIATVNPGFDVTPARLITGFITDRGVFALEDLKDLRMNSHV